MKYPIQTFEFCSQSNHMRSLHGSIIYSNKNPVIQVTNEPAGCLCGKIRPSVHAEMNAIHKARYTLKKINNPVLVVVRYNRNGELANSYPCNLCIDVIKKTNICKVVYSDDNGNITFCKTKDLEYRHLSRVSRMLGIENWNNNHLTYN